MKGEAPLTMSVPEAGDKYFALSRGSSYEAAKRGDIPTIKVGRLLRVPVRALEAMLDNAGRKATNTSIEGSAVPATPTTGSSTTAGCHQGSSGGRQQHNKAHARPTSPRRPRSLASSNALEDEPRRGERS
jgi:hypothetical protein